MARFAAGRAATAIPQLTLARLDGFFALVPGADAPGLHALADEVVRAFDDFRALVTEAELARRNRACAHAAPARAAAQLGLPVRAG